MKIENNDTEKKWEHVDRYVAVPPNGQVCCISGLKHAKLYSLLRKGGEACSKVRVVHLREEGRTRGKMLFHVGDMLRFLDEKAAEREKGGQIG